MKSGINTSPRLKSSSTTIASIRELIKMSVYLQP
jgi:hypothetical protein